MIVVVNDNGRSYAPTTGGMASHLATLRTTREYEKLLDWGKQSLQRGGTPGRLAYETLHGVKKGLKDIVAPQGLFEDLGLKYVGPVDGHDPRRWSTPCAWPVPSAAPSSSTSSPRRAAATSRRSPTTPTASTPSG